MKKLAEIKDPALLESGIFPSLAPNQTALWRTAENVLFVDGAAEKSPGVVQLHAVGAPIVALSQAFVEGEQRAYFAKADTVYKWNAVDGETILKTGFTGSRWSMIPWGTWLLAVNGIEDAQIYKNGGALTMANWAGVPDAAKKATIVRKLALRPILFKGQIAYWPRVTDIEYWTTPDPTGNAGNLQFRDLDSDVVAVEPFGEQLAVYTQNKMGLFSPVGGTFVYGFKMRLEGIGAIALNAVVPVGAKHYGMSRDGIWVSDGSSFQYLDQPAVNRYLDGKDPDTQVPYPWSMDPDLTASVAGLHVKDKGMVQWFYDSNEVVASLPVRRGVGYNYAKGTWHALKMPVTAVAAQEAFAKPLVALGQFFGLYDSGVNLGPNPMATFLQSMPFDAGEVGRYKWWDQVEVHWTGAAPEVRFGLHRHEEFGDDPSDRWTDWTTLARVNWVQQESVYLTMEIRSTTLDTTFRVGGVAVWGEPAGWTE